MVLVRFVQIGDEGHVVCDGESGGDVRAITSIYNHYVMNSVATFDEISKTEDEMRKKILLILQSNYPFLVLEENGVVIGYAYASQWKERPAYRFSVEISIYVHWDSVGKGFGFILISKLLELLQQNIGHVHSVISTIALPNPSCCHLHEKMGFIQVSHYKEVGFKFGKWIDVCCYQKNFSSVKND
jgi:L-amino acid N-acyltransferase YncA